MATNELRLTNLDALADASEWLRVIGHPHRLRMIQMLSHSQYTVGELAEACGVPSAMASEHLRLMQHCGLLSSQRDGRRVYYQIVEPQISEILKCVKQRYGSTV